MCRFCKAIMVDGVIRHAYGCSEAWRDRKRKCRECGNTFKPQEKYQVVCSEDCAIEYYHR
jgi:hypothetical protein